MPNAFNFDASPFDCLSPSERTIVRDSVDIAYFPEGARVLDAGSRPTHLFVIIKGHVKHFEGEELIATYGPDDTFDGRGLVTGKVSGRFVASEEVVAYQLARQAVSDLISMNATFGALLFSDFSNKLSALAERESHHELQSLTMAKVSEAFLRPVHFVDGATDVLSVVKLFAAHHTSNVLVRDAGVDGGSARLGIFTTSGLQNAILHGTPLHELEVREVASFPLVTVGPGDLVFDALTAMIHHQVHRLVVAEGDDIVGVLEQLDLLSFLSNHSHLITLQIADATDIEALRRAASHINRLISLLHQGGTKVSSIAKLVKELNARLFERAWRLIAPEDLIANSCLFVMGSEGRGEQLLKTDQDNGLILKDGYECPHDLAGICERFSSALAAFGYPECPGGIMVKTPEWRQSARDFGQMARRWLLNPNPEGLIALAIFLDAQRVCGDGALLEQVRAEVDELVGGNDALLMRFASAINIFSEGIGWWNILMRPDERDPLDLKKAGIFPLVHGVRSFALEEHLRATGTVERLDLLVAMGRLPRALADELLDSLHFFMGLRLKVGLGQLELGRPVSAAVEIDKLSALDRDLLKDALGVVKRFKTLLRHHFHLDAS
jgi:CBS domain-containing protein